MCPHTPLARVRGAEPRNAKTKPLDHPQTETAQFPLATYKIHGALPVGTTAPYPHPWRYLEQPRFFSFTLAVVEGVSLFPRVKPVKISDLLRQLLDRDGGLATLINTEKARSEFLIAPILADIRQQSKHQVSLFLGISFNVDVEKELIGFCDFSLSQSEEQIDVTAPVVTIIEAKNEPVMGGLGQCMASMNHIHPFTNRADW